MASANNRPNTRSLLRRVLANAVTVALFAFRSVLLLFLLALRGISARR